MKLHARIASCVQIARHPPPMHELSRRIKDPHWPRTKSKSVSTVVSGCPSGLNRSREHRAPFFQ
ncbi:predicted protein [Plenodomus lingam JN3]|uniref:Predicted protein n=1 Tax=Leptosphaeria maculans (strain JN3 / isolate v23.1.3 / race Av1-4-5-6-7-8) TaxID=985895 RepID=E4ZYF6_LEPMJ|nr:predicted protein [Plenodomus lingam JN3]CBX96482.1 predicted protein [Plenodomus lingam JN3]